MIYKIPTIEEIYNTYHRETMHAYKGIYPRPIKNFDKILTPAKIELLTRFQNSLKRNYDLIDWRLYIKACALFFKRNFDLKILGSLKGNKIYRTYIEYDNVEKTCEEVKTSIASSLKFIKIFCEDNEICLKQYLTDRTTNFPIIIKHLYSGAVSPYLYACLDSSLIFKIFGDIYDDVYYELFNCSRNEFLENNVFVKRESILKFSKLRKTINNINEKIIKLFD